MKILSYFIILALSFLYLAQTAMGLNAHDVARMNKAGVSDETIRLMIREKTVETCRFSVEEIIKIKKAGVGNKTLQLMITEGSYLKGREPTVYGDDIKQLKYTTINDIIKLKEAGVSDSVIEAIIIYRSEDSSAADREKAWEMLKNMGIVLDGRKHHRRP